MLIKPSTQRATDDGPTSNVRLIEQDTALVIRMSSSLRHTITGHFCAAIQGQDALEDEVLTIKRITPPFM